MDSRGGRFQNKVMKIEKKATNKQCSEIVGVGRATVSAVRKSLGIPRTVKKVFPSQIHAFLAKNPTFKISDADKIGTNKI